MKPFRVLLDHPAYWSLNRRSITRAFALGLFTAFVPLPIHVVLATVAALAFRVNIPAAVAGTLLTNPFTMVPLFMAAHWVGAKLLDVPHRRVPFEMSWEWVTTTLVTIWKPFLLGCAVLGTLTAAAGYILLGGLWHITLVLKYHERKGASAPKESANVDKSADRAASGRTDEDCSPDR
jgi:uncharacterized protein (DUF2062 family)